MQTPLFWPLVQRKHLILLIWGAETPTPHPIIHNNKLIPTLVNKSKPFWHICCDKTQKTCWEATFWDARNGPEKSRANSLMHPPKREEPQTKPDLELNNDPWIMTFQTESCKMDAVHESTVQPGEMMQETCLTQYRIIVTPCLHDDTVTVQRYIQQARWLDLVVKEPLNLMRGQDERPGVRTRHAVVLG